MPTYMSDFYDGNTPSIIGVDDMNLMTSQMATAQLGRKKGVLKLDPDLVYELDKTFLIRSLVPVEGEGIAAYNRRTGERVGAVLRASTGANCRTVAMEHHAVHRTGLKRVLIDGNRQGQRADSGNMNTGVDLNRYSDYTGDNFIGLHVNLYGTVANVSNDHPDWGSGDHNCHFEDIWVINAGGDGIVFEGGRESVARNLRSSGARRHGIIGGWVDSRIDDIVSDTSGWAGFIAPSPAGTDRTGTIKIWFSGCAHGGDGSESYNAWLTHRAQVKAANRSGFAGVSPYDFHGTPWGVDFICRTSGVGFALVQLQDSDGGSMWMGTTGSWVNAMFDSPGNEAYASDYFSGGMLGATPAQDGPPRKIPVADRRRGLVMAGAKFCTVHLTHGTRMGEWLTDYLVEFIGDNPGCIVTGTGDFTHTKGEVLWSRQEKVINPDGTTTTFNNVPDPEVRVDLAKTRILYPQVARRHLQNASHYINRAWDTGARPAGTTPKGNGTTSYKARGAKVDCTDDLLTYVAQGPLPTDPWVAYGEVNGVVSKISITPTLPV